MKKWIKGYGLVLFVTAIMAFTRICGPISYIAKILFVTLLILLSLSLLVKYRRERRERGVRTSLGFKRQRK